MTRFTKIMIGMLTLFCPTVALAQPPGIQQLMDKNLALEKQGKFREAYVEWGKFLRSPAFRNLADEKVQNVYFTSYFYNARTLFKMATLDPKIWDRQKFIDGTARMILKLETSKSKEGWKFAGPMFEMFLKEEGSAQLKIAYDKLKSERR